MENIKVISKIILIALLIIVVSGAVQFYYKNHYGYEYLDFNENFGIAKKCYFKDKVLFCKTDKGLVDVKQFRKR